MEKSNNQKIKLGIFIILGSLFFITAIYFIGNKQNLFSNTIKISADFSNINGIQIGNNVRFSGINVGTVEAIKIINDSLIRLDLTIENKIAPYIKKNAIASIGSDGLVGSMIVNIVPGKQPANAIIDGDIIFTEKNVSTDDLLKVLNATSINAKIITDNLVKTTNQINGKNGLIGMLLNDSLVSDDLKQTIYNLKTTTKTTSESMNNLNKLIIDLNNKNNVLGTIKDTAVGQKIKNIIVNLEKSSEQINKVVTNLNEGNGAINYLSNDPELVKQIDATMININQASFKLNENLEALKHNIFFRGYFRKQAKAKERAEKAAKQKNK